jgi:hypothetical protein
MQHPDEGTIHTWLDGELAADEASALEAHIAECPECSARVAEARGLVAASSRIVSALDIVPGGVVPAAPVKRRWFATAQFRAAAALAIVAGGSFLVMRDRDEAAMDRIMTTASSPAPEASVSADEAQREVNAAPQAAPPVTRPTTLAMPRKSEAAKIAEIPAPSSPSLPSPLPGARNEATTLIGPVAGVQTGAADVSRATDSIAFGRRAAAERDFAGKGVRGGVARGVERASILPEFRLIRTDSTQSGSRTVFELSPGVEVTLTDAAPIAADAQAKQKESAASAPAPPAAAVMRPDSSQLAPLNTISWVDKRGHSMTLTGRVSVLQLQVLRQQLPEDQR